MGFNHDVHFSEIKEKDVNMLPPKIFTRRGFWVRAVRTAKTFAEIAVFIEKFHDLSARAFALLAEEESGWLSIVLSHQFVERLSVNVEAKLNRWLQIAGPQIGTARKKGRKAHRTLMEMKMDAGDRR